MDKQRLPKIGEHVRSKGTLVSIHDITPIQDPVTGYVFESLEAEIKMRVNGLDVKSICTFNDFYGIKTCLESAVDEAKGWSKKYGPGVEIVVIKRTLYTCKSPMNRENFYNKDFFDFETAKDTFRIRDQIPEDQEVEYWSSDRGFIEESKVTGKP